MVYTKGAMPPKTDLRDYKYIPVAMAAEEAVIPPAFELEVGEVKNQGAIGSCVAHVAAEIEEYFNKKETHMTIPLSPGYVYGRRYEYKGEGMYLRDALKTLRNYGVCYNDEFPYNEEVPLILDKFNAVKEWKTDKYHQISSYFSIDVNDADAIKQALLNFGPVMGSVKWYSDIKVKDGIIESRQDFSFGYHCIMIYGYNEQGWLIQNSWGSKWGNGGRAIYPYELGLTEAWGISDTTTYNPDVKEKKLNPLMDFILKLLSALINLIKKS